MPDLNAVSQISPLAGGKSTSPAPASEGALFQQVLQEVKEAPALGEAKAKLAGDKLSPLEGESGQVGVTGPLPAPGPQLAAAPVSGQLASQAGAEIPISARLPVESALPTLPEGAAARPGSASSEPQLVSPGTAPGLSGKTFPLEVSLAETRALESLGVTGPGPETDSSEPIPPSPPPLTLATGGGRPGRLEQTKTNTSAAPSRPRARARSAEAEASPVPFGQTPSVDCLVDGEAGPWGESLGEPEGEGENAAPGALLGTADVTSESLPAVSRQAAQLQTGELFEPGQPSSERETAQAVPFETRNPAGFVAQAEPSILTEDHLGAENKGEGPVWQGATPHLSPLRPEVLQVVAPVEAPLQEEVPSGVAPPRNPGEDVGQGLAPPQTPGEFSQGVARSQRPFKAEVSPGVAAPEMARKEPVSMGPEKRSKDNLGQGTAASQKALKEHSSQEVVSSHGPAQEKLSPGLARSQRPRNEAPSQGPGKEESPEGLASPENPEQENFFHPWGLSENAVQEERSQGLAAGPEVVKGEGCESGSLAEVVVARQDRQLPTPWQGADLFEDGEWSGTTEVGSVKVRLNDLGSSWVPELRVDRSLAGHANSVRQLEPSGGEALTARLLAEVSPTSNVLQRELPALPVDPLRPETWKVPAALETVFPGKLGGATALNGTLLGQAAPPVRSSLAEILRVTTPALPSSGVEPLILPPLLGETTGGTRELPIPAQAGVVGADLPLPLAAPASGASLEAVMRWQEALSAPAETPLRKSLLASSGVARAVPETSQVEPLRGIRAVSEVGAVSPSMSVAKIPTLAFAMPGAVQRPVSEMRIPLMVLESAKGDGSDLAVATEARVPEGKAGLDSEMSGSQGEASPGSMTPVGESPTELPGLSVSPARGESPASSSPASAPTGGREQTSSGLPHRLEEVMQTSRNVSVRQQARWLNEQSRQVELHLDNETLGQVAAQIEVQPGGRWSAQVQVQDALAQQSLQREFEILQQRPLVQGQGLTHFTTTLMQPGGQGDSRSSQGNQKKFARPSKTSGFLPIEEGSEAPRSRGDLSGPGGVNLRV